MTEMNTLLATPSIGTPELIFSGGRLLPFSEKHLTQRYVDWLKDPDVIKFSERRHENFDLDICRTYLESMRSEGNYFWAIEKDDGGPDAHIGNIAAYVDRPNGVADLSIIVGEKEAWGRGYGKSAWVTACDWLLGEGGFRKVATGTMSENLPMLALMRASGMVEEGRRKSQFIVDGEPMDLIMAGRFA